MGQARSGCQPHPHDAAHLPTRSVKIGLGLFEVDVTSGKCVPQPRREALESFRPVDAGVGSVVLAVPEAEPIVVIASSWCGPEGYGSRTSRNC